MGKTKLKLEKIKRLKSQWGESTQKPTIAQQWDAASKEGIRLNLERKENDVKRKADALERQRKNFLQAFLPKKSLQQQ